MDIISAPLEATPSQRDQILAHLKAGMSLTPLDALVKFKCMALSQRIGELKRAGHRIHSGRKELLGHDGKKKRVAEYRMDRRED